MTILQGPVRISLVELLLGLFAALSDELRLKAAGEPVSMKPPWLFQKLTELGQQDTYVESFRSLEEEGFTDLVSQMKTWRVLTIEDGGRGIIMNETQASRQLGNIGRNYGVASVEKLRQLAIDLLNPPQKQV